VSKLSECLNRPNECPHAEQAIVIEWADDGEPMEVACPCGSRWHRRQTEFSERLWPPMTVENWAPGYATVRLEAWRVFHGSLRDFREGQ